MQPMFQLLDQAGTVVYKAPFALRQTLTGGGELPIHPPMHARRGEQIRVRVTQTPFEQMFVLQEDRRITGIQFLRHPHPHFFLKLRPGASER